ncbi:MAG: hypothetical protein ACXVBB_08520 [Isosphaeraceae bacterium]
MHRRPGPADQSGDHGTVRRDSPTVRARTSQANILAAVARLAEARPAEVSRFLRIEKSTLSRDGDAMS